MKKRIQFCCCQGKSVELCVMGIILFLAVFCLPGRVSRAAEKGESFTDSNGIRYSITSVTEGEKTVSIQDGTSFTGTELPDYVTYEGESYYVTGILFAAFKGNESLALTSLPDGICKIGDYAFYGCSKLALAAIPEGVTAIGRYAFYNCIGLTDMILPDSIQKIGQGAFYACENWKLTRLSGNLQTIEDWTFGYCKNLCITTIPENVTAIGSSAFYGCIGLKRLSMSDGVLTIGFEAFRECANLSWIRLSDTITSIDSQVFSRCLSLEWVCLPSALTNLSDGLFDYCDNLDYVVLGDNIQEIDEGAFDTYSPHVIYSGADTATSAALAEAETHVHFYANPTLTWDGSQGGLGSGDNYISKDLYVTESVTIKAGNTLTVTAGVHLTISGNFIVEEGAEVVIANGGVLTVTGTFENYGIITNSGTIENQGVINNYGTIHSYQGIIEGTEVFGNAPLVSRIVVTGYSGMFDAKPHPGAEITEVAEDETLSYSTNYSKYYLSNPDAVIWSETCPEYTTIEDAKEPLTVKAERDGKTVAIISVNVIIRRAKAVIVTYPSSSPILEGDILSKSALLGGKAVIEGTDIELKGEFFWGSIIRDWVPALSDSGVTEISAYFRPSEFSLQNVDIKTFQTTVEVIECIHDGTGREILEKSEASCEHTGERHLICTQCKDVLENITVPLKEHTWDEGNVTTPATMTAAGIRTYTCSVCGSTKTEEIPKLANPDATLKPGETEGPGMTPKPGEKPTPGTTTTPDNGGDSYTGNTPGQNEDTSNGELKKGMNIRDKKTNGIYIVTKVTATGGTVTYSKPIKKKASIKIPDNIQYKDKVLKVTAVKSKAFYKHSKLKKCVVGRNVKTIGTKAFYGCKKMSYIKFKGKKLSKIGKKAFTRMGSRAKRIKIYVSKKNIRKYKKLFRKKGLVSRAVFRSA